MRSGTKDRAIWEHVMSSIAPVRQNSSYRNSRAFHDNDFPSGTADSLKPSRSRLTSISIWAYIKFAEYEVTSADRFGAPVTAILLSYLIHLWLLPADVLQGDEDEGDPSENNSDDN